MAARESGERHNRDYVEHLKAMGEASTWLDISEMTRGNVVSNTWAVS